MISLQDVSLIIHADNSETVIHHLPDGHYGPLLAVVEREHSNPYAPQGTRGLDIRLAKDYIKQP